MRQTNKANSLLTVSSFLSNKNGLLGSRASNGHQNQYYGQPQQPQVQQNQQQQPQVQQALQQNIPQQPQVQQALQQNQLQPQPQQQQFQPLDQQFQPQQQQFQPMQQEQQKFQPQLQVPLQQQPQVQQVTQPQPAQFHPQRSRSVDRSMSNKIAPNHYQVESDKKKRKVNQTYDDLGSEDSYSPMQTLYELNNEERFDEQLQVAKVDKRTKSTIKKMHSEMLGEITSLKKKLEQASTDSRLQATTIERINIAHQHDYDELEKRESELKALKEEIALKETNQQIEIQNYQTYEKELHKFKQMYYKLDYANGHMKDQIAKLTTESSEFRVKNLTLEYTNRDLKDTNELLAKTLEIRDTAIATKIVSYDERMRELSEDHRFIKEYAAKVVECYTNMAKSQTAYLDKFEQTAKHIDNIEYQTTQVQTRLLAIEEGPFQNINKNLSVMNSTIVVGLQRELAEALKNREWLVTNWLEMGSEFKEAQQELREDISGIVKDVSQMKEIRSQNYNALLPMFVACTAITILAMLAIQHFFFWKY